MVRGYYRGSNKQYAPIYGSLVESDSERRERKENKQMGLTVKDNGGGDFELIPEATYIATSSMLIDLGTHDYEYMGNSGTKKQIYIGWELDACDSQGKPFVIGKYYTASLGKKANLRKDLEAWRGRAFTDEELSGFQLINILGKSCSIGIIHKEAGEYKKPRISSIQALPKGVPPHKVLNQPTVFDMDDWNTTIYEGLPDFLKTTIKESSEYKAMVEDGLITDTLAEGPSPFPADMPEEDIAF
jgi:hypothetical protein